MSTYIITSDNTTDLPISYLQEHQVPYMSLTCHLDGKVYNKDNELSAEEFYQRMRAGSMPTTSQVNPEDAKALFEPLLKEGKDVLHLAFSSGLSGSYNSCRIAAEELAEAYPMRRIQVIDSLCASLGEGLLLHKMLKMQEDGKSMEEVAAWAEENKFHLCHVFTVDDLNHLYRGGRVSKLTAVVGTMLNIKPMLHVNDEGKLIALGKVRGRKKSLCELVDMMEERIGSYRDQNEEIFISHGDCLEDAQFVAKRVEEKYGISTFLIHPVGSTIGAHSGPGTVALFFMGERR